MGTADELKWKSMRQHGSGCRCDWCMGMFYFLDEAKLINGIVQTTGAKLPDGEIVVIGGYQKHLTAYTKCQRLTGDSWPKTCWALAGYDPWNTGPDLSGYSADGFTAKVVEGPAKKKILSKDAPPGGSNCKKCKNNNPWAAPNQDDNTYVCYACR